MMSNTLLVTVLYFLVSLFIFLLFYSASRAASGVGFTVGRFWFCFAGVMLWGIVQLSVAYDGYTLLYLPSKDIFQNNYLVRWIAFISAILQTICIPDKDDPKRWYSRK